MNITSDLIHLFHEFRFSLFYLPRNNLLRRTFSLGAAHRLNSPFGLESYSIIVCFLALLKTISTAGQSFVQKPLSRHPEPDSSFPYKNRSGMPPV